MKHTTKGHIFLYLEPRGTWMADMSAASDAQEIQELFETTQIPTPFCRWADWKHVQATVAARNPDDDAVVDILSRGDVEACDACKALNGYVLLDDGYQPTGGECPQAKALYRAYLAV